MEIVEGVTDVISSVLTVVFKAISQLSAASLDVIKRKTVRRLKQMQIYASLRTMNPLYCLRNVKERRQQKLLLNEGGMVPRLNQYNNRKQESNVWYLDNGASNHMTGYREKFTYLDEGVTGKVRFGDGSTVDIKGRGSISVSCKNGEEHVFHEVYYIPELCNNIISLGQLSEAGNKVVLKGEFMWIYDNRRRLLMKVKKSGNRLYKIKWNQVTLYV